MARTSSLLILMASLWSHHVFGVDCFDMLSPASRRNIVYEGQGVNLVIHEETREKYSGDVNPEPADSLFTMHRMDLRVGEWTIGYIRVRYISQENSGRAKSEFSWSDEQLSYWVDKPKIDFIFIHESYRGRGFGELLYRFMARWLADEKSLPLYASENQQAAAQSLWLKMQESADYPVRTEQETNRVFLDYRNY